MKTTILSSLAVAFMVISTPLHAQTYQVAVSQRPYVNLTGGQSLVNGVWSSLDFEVPLGFSLNFFNEDIQSLYSADFYGGGYVTSSLNFSETNVLLMFSAYILDRGLEADSAISPVTYKTEGSAGNRIFTLEFENVGFGFGETDNGVYTDYINYQLKIYEAHGDIEVHIGPYQIDSPELDFEGHAGPSIGLVEAFDFNAGQPNGEICLLDGNPTAPAVITNSIAAELNWPIPPNTVYKFYREPSRVNEPGIDYSVNYYTPNPASGNIRLQSQWEGKIVGPVTVINSSGMIVSKDIDADVIEMEGLPGGVYQLFFETSEGYAGQRILVVGH